MPLNKAQLILDLKAIRTAPRPKATTPEEIALMLETILTELADAIDAFVRSGAVIEVAVEVRSTAPPNAIIGTGTQTGTGRIT